jgi:hypothetical protein
MIPIPAPGIGVVGATPFGHGLRISTVRPSAAQTRPQHRRHWGCSSGRGGRVFDLLGERFRRRAHRFVHRRGAPVSRFPEIRVARTVENGLCLAVLALWVPLALALFYGLRTTRPASALFGCALNIFGLAVLAAGAIPHVVSSRLSDLYHAAGVTPDEQATLVLLWQANAAIFDALLLVMPVGVILFGLVMRLDRAYGKVVGNISVALGAVGLAAAMVMLVDPPSPAAALGVFALIGFHLVAGWKTYRLSTAA